MNRLLLTFLMSVTFASLGQTNDMKIRFDVEKYQLDNGLTVLLHEDHTVPIVSYQTWFRVGSKHEEEGYTGIAHLFEHMMFKGAKRYTNKQFDQILRENGAVNNAFTTRDYTAYYINLPSSRLELAIDLESDRMENLQITEENLKSEREVVKEERRFRVENSIMGTLYENIYDRAYQVHPYRWPVIGWMKDLNNITVEKCKEFFKTYYSPNNAVIVVAGDFDSSKVKSLIRKYYAHMPRQEIPSKDFPSEPEQQAQRYRTVSKVTQSNQFALAYHVSEAGHEDSYALDLLADILGGGTSSRLHRRLVYNAQLADSAYSYAYTPEETGLFQVFVSLKPNADLERAKKIVFGELWKARNHSFTEEEIEKAKTSVLMSYVDSLKSINGKARAIALNEVVLGSYEYLFKDIDRYLQITEKDLKRVAKKYLNPHQGTFVLVKPKNQAGG